MYKDFVQNFVIAIRKTSSNKNNSILYQRWQEGCLLRRTPSRRLIIQMFCTARASDSENLNKIL